MMSALTTDDLLDSAYRVVRRLAPPEAPYSGLLARDGADAVVLVDPEALPGVARQRARGPHVLAPVDVACIGSERRLVLPWCVEPLPRVITQRSDEINAGEAVTIAISLCRGMMALHPHRGEEEAQGSWWLTDSGRPVFAVGGDGARPIGDATHELWSALAAATADAEVRACLLRFHVDDEATPAALFALAEPTPVNMTPATPRRVSALPARRVDPLEDTAPMGTLAAAWSRAVERFVDPEWGARVAEAAEAVRRRFARARGGEQGEASPAPSAPAASPSRARGRTSSRGRAVVWGGLVAGVVLAAGLLWPSDSPNAEADATALATRTPSVASESTIAPTPTPSQTGSATMTEPPRQSASPAPTLMGSDPTTALSDLLQRAAECDDLTTCGDVFEDAEEPPTDVKLPLQPASVVLLDDLGGVAVFRVGVEGDADGPRSLVVILADGEAGWRIRDVRTLAAP